MVKRNYTVKDAKFYKPNQADPVTVNTANLQPVVAELHDLGFNTSYGGRVVKRFTKDMLCGRFDVDDGTLSKTDPGIPNPDTPPEPGQPLPEPRKAEAGAKEDPTTKKKLEKFFEEFWAPLHKMVMNQRALGEGFMIPTTPKEAREMLYRPLNPRVGEEIRWVAPETRHMGLNTMILQPPVLEPKFWSNNWQWHDINVNRDRLYIYCPLTDELVWHGIGEVEPIRIPLWAMYNLERGCLDRIAAWALKKMIYQVDFTKVRGTGRAQMEELMKAQNEENYYMLDSADNLVQLNDKNGMGTELETICTHAISAHSGLPTVMIQGTQPGATTGSEVNLSEYEFTIIGEQTPLTDYIKPILLDWYGIDADRLIWHPDAFLPEQIKLQNEGMRAVNQGLKQGSPFGKGNSPIASPKDLVPGVGNKNPEKKT